MTRLIVAVFIVLSAAFLGVSGSASSSSIKGKLRLSDEDMLSPIRSFYPSLISSSLQGTTIVVPYISNTRSSRFISTTNDQGKSLPNQIIDHDDDFILHEREEYCHQNAIVLFKYNSENQPPQQIAKEITKNHHDCFVRTSRKRSQKIIDELSLIYDSFDEDDITENNHSDDQFDSDSYYADIPISQLDHASSLRWTLLGLPSDTPNNNCNLCLLAMTGLFVDIDYLTRQVQSMIHQYRIIFEESDHEANTDIMLSSTSSSPNPKSTRLFNQVVLKLCYLLREATMYTNSRPYGVQALLIGMNGATIERIVRKNNRNDSHPLTVTNSSHTTTFLQRITSLLRIYTIDPSGSYHHWSQGTAIGRNAGIIRQRLCRLLSASLPDGEPTNGYEALRIAIHASMIKVPIVRNNLENDDSILQPMHDHDSDDMASPTMQQSDEYEAYLVWHDTNQNNILKYTTIDPDQIKSIVAHIRGRRMLHGRVKDIIET